MNEIFSTEILGQEAGYMFLVWGVGFALSFWVFMFVDIHDDPESDYETSHRYAMVMAAMWPVTIPLILLRFIKSIISGVSRAITRITKGR